jgi:hypothetical protein
MNHIKHEIEHNVRLTSAEIANLWSSYMSDSMAKCVLRYFLEKVEDTQIKPIIEYALSLAEKHIQTMADIFISEAHPIPQAFTDEDVDVTAPRLFADTFLLTYLKQMARVGVNSNSMALALSTRSDVVHFYTECLASSAELNNKATALKLSKGIYIRPPYISVPENVEFVQKQNFLNGLFGENRPLLAVEIAHLYANVQTNGFGKAMLIGFSHVAKSKDVREYTARGKEVYGKHVQVLGTTMQESDLPIPMTWDTDVMESTVSPFSDKLMMFHVSALNSVGIGDYGVSISMTMRKDLTVNYSRLATELGLYAQDGAKLMIENTWMEQPPQADDRKALAGV